MDFDIEHGTLERAFVSENETTAVIPEGVTKIGGFVFSGCSSLTSIVIPEGVTSIGWCAFWKCKKLSSVVLPKSLTQIGESAFSDCSSLTSFVIPQGVTSIGETAFRGCKKLSSVVFPKGLTEIGHLAFEGCTALTSIVIPEGVTKIGGSAFYDCKRLTNVVIPESVTSLGCSAFEGTRWLNQKRKTSPVIAYGILIDGESCSGDLIIPEGVHVIADYAFAHCSSLTSIVIPEGVTSIGEWAFSQNHSLKSVVIPSSVKTIGDGAFRLCSSLASIVIPSSVKTIGDGAFDRCSSLTSIVIPEGVTEIGEEAFIDCRKLKSIVIPGSVKTIEECAFKGCRRLKSIVFPEGIVSIKENAFTGCPLESVVIPKSLSEVEPGEFFGFEGNTLQTIVTALSEAGIEYPYTLHPMEALALIILTGKGKGVEKSVSSWMKTKKCSTEAAVNAISSVIARGVVKCSKWALDLVLDNVTALDVETLRAFHDALASTQSSYLKKLQQNETVRQMLGLDGAEAPAALHPVEQLVRDYQKQHYDRRIHPAELSEGIPYADGTGTCSVNTLEVILSAYAAQLDIDILDRYSEYRKSYPETHILPQIDAIAAGLDQEALQALLAKLTEDPDRDLGLLLPLGRYGSREQILNLISGMKTWPNVYRSKVAGRKRTIVARGALMLSEHRDAMIEVDSTGGLDYYASLRGTDADTIRDTVLSDFGFDVEGQKRLDLGPGCLRVTLLNDLTLDLLDECTGKTVKSVPKKGSDPALYETAKKDLAEMKKNIRRVYTNRKKALFADFLNKKTVPQEKWQATYLGNPVLRAIARLLVWQQDGKRFVIAADDALRDANGAPYQLTGADILLAHPMEMPPEETQQWRDHFLANGLKQPFEQIWEPAYDLSRISPDRYRGAVLSIYRFTGKEEHGITAYGYHAFSEEYYFKLADCDLDIDDRSDVRMGPLGGSETYTLGEFTITTPSRRANHIVSLLDRWIFEARLIKDDVSVMELAQDLTLAQVLAYIKTAGEHNCVNCMAALLEYKNQHFEAVDPFAELTLD